MTGAQEFAPAKVNLYLHVVGRRPDGYHLLDSLIAFPDVGDVVSASVEQGGQRSSEVSLSIDGPFAGAIADDPDNLVLRAARALRPLAPGAPSTALALVKNLPVAAGIGGGSSDAAATLRLLARLWRVAIPPHVALQLGADVPVCLRAAPCRMAGVGDVLSPVPALPDAGILLVNPGHSVATPAVFRNRVGAFSHPAELPSRWADARDLADWLRPLANDLEAPAVALCPVIAEVLATLRGLPGCLLARMSGSGATCFSLFASPSAARAAADQTLALERAGWWAWGGRLGHPTLAPQDGPLDA